MKRNRGVHDQELRAMLRRGDPARDGQAPDAEHWVRMRRDVVLRVQPGRRWERFPLPAMSAAAALFLVLIATWTVRPEPVGVSPTPKAGPAMIEGTQPAPRQIQFATRGGTRIIWVLDPDFDV